ncbi:peptidoglycan-binding domain-containing protein [Albidovulum sediminis]|uniref:Peptidoglycan-binding protein n=1 Tax=Albidovulum sediminis TaxID=3066345 RepID=A0ABT2NNM9_9RHOB|nr:peptidoglycan-binding domain-containing protein [Defluviimonas sediminis]MCT8330521.1 peptidoglycan-binding protein [Defluviimonas sediminis]
MKAKRIATSCVAAALMAAQSAPARADLGDALVGGVVGGVIGGVIVNEANKKKQPAATSAPTVSSAQRAANAEVQTALNYFGYPAGTPDGVMGARSRAAVSEYQATLGYPATGQLTDYERSHLLTSYHRAVAGGPATAQAAAANPMGMRGLLVTWRDEALGVAPAATTTAVAPATGLPTFLGTAGAQVSLASFCNRVGLMTTTNGGYTTVADMTDPMEALGEQLCLTRSYAIAQGEEMAARVPGTTPEQIAQQCAGFGPAMKAELASLSLDPAPAVLEGVKRFALGTGMPPAQLSSTARICLSVGYRTDAMDVATASALLLAGLGESAYAEVLGHHLSQGFGATQRTDLAFDWYDIALQGAERPGAAVFAPGQPERMALVRKAAYAMVGREDDAATTPVPAALPSFGVPEASN